MASKNVDLMFRLMGKDMTGPATKSAAGNLDHVGQQAANMGKVLAGVAAGAGLAVLGKQAKDFAVESVAAFTTVGKEAGALQRVMGGSIEEASGMRGMFKLAGLDADAAGKSMGLFSKSIVNNGEAFAGMGIAVRDAGGQLRPTNDILKDTAEKFQQMPAGAEKTALALELFGKSGTSMLPFLNRGAEGLTALEQKTAEYGLTLSKVDREAIVGASSKAQRELVHGHGGREGHPRQRSRAAVHRGENPDGRHGRPPHPGAAARVPGGRRRRPPGVDPDPGQHARRAGRGPRLRLRHQGRHRGIRDSWPQIVASVGNVVGGVLGLVRRIRREHVESLPGLPPGAAAHRALAVAQKTRIISVAFSAASASQRPGVRPDRHRTRRQQSTGAIGASGSIWLPAAPWAKASSPPRPPPPRGRPRRAPFLSSSLNTSCRMLTSGFRKRRKVPRVRRL
ncbi:MAG: phage tail tape measure protein [Tessaracoccus sp.]|uniref:phage tail tape measure protein n=1 Tax=Tessaracoccus sp. TaxID=1971211 RepID=UPI001ED33226|nr:phage tail tape measure protein [Tessaracoccus sp.]MBK7823597.1 phage tail tape measure protein [Tessaracoccus sp.]